MVDLDGDGSGYGESGVIMLSFQLNNIVRFSINART